MCQRFQNSDAVREKNGCLKFLGRRTLKIWPIPRATSIVPEKSQYSCSVYRMAANAVTPPSNR